MQRPLIDKLVHYLFENKERWVGKHELLGKDWKYDDGRKYLASTADRKLREAEENKRIAVKYVDKNTLYKWLPHERRASYIPTSIRKDDRLFTA
jgi:hypothetical protein